MLSTDNQQREAAITTNSRAGTPELNMRTLVTGSSGHLGEALVRTLRQRGADVVGLDSRPSKWTDVVGSVTDPGLLREVMAGVEVVFHTATLHKPQLAFVPSHEFVETNISGTHHLLEAAVAANVRSFVMTSSTTVFGDALVPPPGEPAAWIDESVVPIPKNIYGVTKAAAEDLCQLAHRNDGLACVVLRVARFFAEFDDMPDDYDGRTDDNIKANEYACRRVALEDAVDAHLRAAQLAPSLDSPGTSSPPPRRSLWKTWPSCEPTQPRCWRVGCPMPQRYGPNVAGGSPIGWTACTSTPGPARNWDGIHASI